MLGLSALRSVGVEHEQEPENVTGHVSNTQTAMVKPFIHITDRPSIVTQDHAVQVIVMCWPSISLIDFMHPSI